MKNKLTRKLMLSAFTLLFAVISLGASTYAWFTMSKQAQINAFEGTVQAGEGIEIAVTATNALGTAQWYTGNVPSSVVEAAYTTNGFTAFAALSTINNGVDLVKYDGTSALTSSYIKFYVHIKTAKAGTVNLSQIKLGSSGPGVEGWKSDAVYNLPTDAGAKGQTVNVGDTVKYKVEDAARIYVKQAIYEKETKIDASNNNLAGIASKYGAYSYYDSKNPDDKLVQDAENYTEYTTVTLSDTNFPGEGEELTNNVTSAVLGTTVNPGEYFTFEVKIWIEGWDSECLNAIFAQTLKVQFGVSLSE